MYSLKRPTTFWIAYGILKISGNVFRQIRSRPSMKSARSSMQNGQRYSQGLLEFVRRHVCLSFARAYQTRHRSGRRIATRRLSSQYPDVSMMNWETAQPNPRYWVLKLLKTISGPVINSSAHHSVEATSLARHLLPQPERKYYSLTHATAK